MPTGDPILDALDFEPERHPQCECCGKCPHHPPGVRCEYTAMFYTRVHAFGFCKQPGLNAGGAVHIVCSPCLIHHDHLAREMVEASHAKRKRLGRYVTCPSCAMNVVDLHKIWETRPYDAVI